MELVLRGLHWTTCYLLWWHLYETRLWWSYSKPDRHSHMIQTSRFETKFKEMWVLQICSHLYWTYFFKWWTGTEPSKQLPYLWVACPKITYKHYLGLCSYDKCFVHKYALIAHPFQRLTQKYVPFEWTKDCSSAFQTLKEALTSIVAFQNFHHSFSVQLHMDLAHCFLRF